MAQEPKTAGRLDFRGGISRLRRQNQNEVFYCQNGRFMSDGTIEVRPGQLERVSISSSGNIETIYIKHSSNLGSRFYSIQRSGNPNDDCYVGNTKITGPSFGKSSYSSIVEYKGTIFFSNGVTPINYHEPGSLLGHTWGADTWGSYIWGSSVDRFEMTGSPAPPKGSHILIYKDRMYVGSSDGNLYYSNTGLYTTLPTVDFPALNFQPIGGLNDPVTGLIAGNNFIVAFTSGSYQIMTGTPGDDGGLGDMSWQVIDNIGTRSGRSISSQGRKIAFLGTDKRVYMLEGTILTDIDPLDHVKEYLTGFNDSVSYAVSSAFHGDELWWYIPVGLDVKTGICLVYNITIKNWTVFTNINGFALYFSKSLGKLYVGKSDESKIYEQESGSTDPGNSLIPIKFVSRQEVLEDLRRMKLYKMLNTQLDVNQDESITVSYSVNDSKQFTEFGMGSPVAPTGKTWGSETWGASPWGGIKVRNSFLYPVSGKGGVRGVEMRIKIEGNVSPGTRILSYELEGEIEPRDESVGLG